MGVIPSANMGKLRKTGRNHGLGYYLFAESVIYSVIILKMVIVSCLITAPVLLPHLLYFLSSCVTYGTFCVTYGTVLWKYVFGNLNFKILEVAYSSYFDAEN